MAVWTRSAYHGYESWSVGVNGGVALKDPTDTNAGMVPCLFTRTSTAAVL